MAQAWVAFLRGINLGSRNRVPMPALRTVFEEAGCGSVSTYIQSGNVVFTKRASDRFKVVGSDVFLHYPKGVQGARLTHASLERRLDVIGTTRNWNTVTRLAELAAQAAGKR